MKALHEYLSKMDSLKQESILYNSDYNFGGFVVQVQANDYRIISALDDYFEKFIHEFPVQIHAVVNAYEDEAEKIEILMQTRQPEPGKTNLKEMYTCEEGALMIHKIKTGVNFLIHDVQRIAHGPLLNNINQLVNFINNIKMDDLLQKAEGQIFHAAGVSKNFVGMGLAGQSGRGKSTLCLKLLGGGIDFVSNDRLVVDQEDGYLMMNGIPKYPRVNPGTVLHQPNIQSIMTGEEIETYSAMSKEELWPIEKKYDVKIEKYFDACEFKFDAEMKYFVFINWDPSSDAEMSLQEINIANRKELLPHVMKSPGLMLPKSKSRLEPLSEKAYVDLLSHCTLMEISGGVDFEKARQDLLSLL